MLNQRQISILLEFCKHTDEFFTASYFADKLKVSLRTIQADMREIKRELSDETCARLVSKSSKGSCIEVLDHDEFSAYVNSLYQQYTTSSLNYPTTRINKLLLMLLNRHRAISMIDVEDEFYISRSTLLNDLKKVEEILQEYQLELLKSSNKIMIEGYEINKRRCLAKQDLYLAHVKNEYGVRYIDERNISKLKNILTEVFVDFKYHIMDTEFNNTIMYLNIMICRMEEGFYIQPDELKIAEDLGKEYELSSAVFERISSRFFIRVTDEEKKIFSLYLKSQGNNRDSDTISAEMDEFVSRAFAQIYENFEIDFSNNINLKITLSLHCMSLRIRLQYDMQMKNEMVGYIRETFPLGYDIASYFAFLFGQEYGKKVSKDEIGLIAIHFYSTLMEMNIRDGRRKILIISSSKPSMSLLTKQTLLRWFSDSVSTVDFVNPMEMTEDMLDEYDIFLTTEKKEFYEKGLAMYIAPFPTKHDYMNIKLNLDGFRNIEDVIAIFVPELFVRVKKPNKKEIFDVLCEKAESNFDISGLREQVRKREEIGSTFFSKGIAVPHPMYAVSSDTFVAVAVLDSPLVWDEEGNEVSLVMLNHVGKNNPRAFQMWNYFLKFLLIKL